jgi:hypothetical protein
MSILFSNIKMAPERRSRKSTRKTPYKVHRPVSNRLEKFIRDENIIPKLKKIFRELYGKDFGTKYSDYSSKALNDFNIRSKFKIELAKIYDIITFLEFHISKKTYSQEYIQEFLKEKIYEFDLRDSSSKTSDYQKYYNFMIQVIYSLLDSIIFDFEEEAAELLEHIIKEIDYELHIQNVRVRDDVDDLIGSFDNL